MTKKRARVGKRRTPRRPAKAAKPESSEGEREFRYFVPQPGRARLPKRERATGRAKSARRHSRATGVSTDDQVEVAYWTPPPKPKPFWTWTDDEIFAWLDKQDLGYQETARQMAALAQLPVAQSERRRGSSPCVCGYDGTPNRMHKWNCTIGVLKEPPPRWAREPVTTVEGDDDDDLPF